MVITTKSEFMNLSLVLLCLSAALSAVGDISGILVGQDGGTIPGARVFAEPGVENALVEGQVAPDGSFTLSGAFYGPVGVFAVAPNRGYGGVHLNLASGESPTDLRIVLPAATAVRGQVTDTSGAAISGAKVTSVALLHPVKVGIPLIKLSEFGMTLPASDASGQFEVGGLPPGGVIALKVSHPRYAQEAVSDIDVGAQPVRIVMYRGVTVRGMVVIPGMDTPVSGAIVTARNAQPPHDTAFAATDRTGAFALQLKPGVYLWQASGAKRMSPGLQRMEISGEWPEQQIRLTLAEVGTISGEIRDAKTGNPIPGLRIVLETRGHASGMTRTGPDGRFRFAAPEGVNLLHFDTAQGYLPPDTRAMRVMVVGDEVLELPGLWLAPAPEFHVRIYEADGTTPVPGAFISLLWPRQFGWQLADGEGLAILRVAALPEDGRILGIVEHPRCLQVALFALDRSQAQGAAVTLFPAASVSGQLASRSGTPLSGAVIGGMYVDDQLPEALPLWRAVTDASGAFSWPAVIPGVPQRCTVRWRDHVSETGRDVNPAPGERLDLGPILVTADPTGMPPVSPEAPWSSLELLCGPRPDMTGLRGIVAFFCAPDEAAVYVEAAQGMVSVLQPFGVYPVVVAQGVYACADAGVPVYRSPVAAGTVTRVYTASGRLTFESVGLPPVSALQALSGN